MLDKEIARALFDGKVIDALSEVWGQLGAAERDLMLPLKVHLKATYGANVTGMTDRSNAPLPPDVM